MKHPSPHRVHGRRRFQPPYTHGTLRHRLGLSGIAQRRASCASAGAAVPGAVAAVGASGGAEASLDGRDELLRNGSQRRGSWLVDATAPTGTSRSFRAK